MSMALDNAALAQSIEDWFLAEARDLPWRRTRTAWGALVSEFMLQQTQVSTVVDRFELFMQRFPAPNDMALADIDQVLQLWQGMGYYRRARNLHRAAQYVVAHFDGVVPTSEPQLRELPGVGRYTAGSIASIVGGHRVPIVDGNVTRLLSRLHADDAARDDRQLANRTWLRAEALVDACNNPSHLNEGMMELGAMICRPAKPRCQSCPISEDCSARSEGLQDSIPRPKQAIARTMIHQHSIIIRRRGRLLLEQRGDSGLWAGLWQSPTIDGEEELDSERIIRELDVPVQSLHRHETITRQLTHRIVRIHVYSGCLVPRARVPEQPNRKWVRVSDLSDYALSSAARAALSRGVEAHLKQVGQTSIAQ